MPAALVKRAFRDVQLEQAEQNLDWAQRADVFCWHDLFGQDRRVAFASGCERRNDVGTLAALDRLVPFGLRSELPCLIAITSVHLVNCGFGFISIRDRPRINASPDLFAGG